MQHAVQLGYLQNGNVALMSDRPFPHDVKRVEYYRDQRLMMLVYDDPSHEGDLMNYELSDEAASKVEHSRNVLIYVDDMGNGQPHGYYTYLIQVGA